MIYNMLHWFFVLTMMSIFILEYAEGIVKNISQKIKLIINFNHTSNMNSNTLWLSITIEKTHLLEVISPRVKTGKNLSSFDETLWNSWYYMRVQASPVVQTLKTGDCLVLYIVQFYFRYLLKQLDYHMFLTDTLSFVLIWCHTNLAAFLW